MNASAFQDLTPDQKVWVVFSGQADLPYLKILKKGFRHCFVVIKQDGHWLTLDPISSYTELLVHPVPTEFDLPGWLRARGHKVIAAPLNRNIRKPAPAALFTCVEAVKRILGLHNRLIFTPWQLYRHLRRLSLTSSSISTSDQKEISYG